MVDESFDERFGDRLRRLRGKRSQQLIADSAGMSQAKISDLETQTNRPLLTPAQFVALADALGVSLQELVGLDDPLNASIPGWSQLSPDHRRVLRDFVEAYAHRVTGSLTTDAGVLQDAADQLTPRERRGGRRIEEAVQQRAAEESGTYDAGSSSAAQDEEPRPRGGRRAR